MDVEVDHYTILGLPSGVGGSKLSEQEIHRAYRSKARELHPDKRLGDPNAHANFLKLQTSYEVLKDAKARKLCDDLLRLKRDRLRPQGQRDPKRQRTMRSDLEERERSSLVGQRNRQDEERLDRKLKEEMAEISAMQSSKKMYNPVASFEEQTRPNEPSGPDGGGGAGFRAFKESVLEKLKKAAQRQNGVVIM